MPEIVLVETNAFHTETLLLACHEFYEKGFSLRVFAPQLPEVARSFLEIRFGAKFVSQIEEVSSIENIFFNTIENFSSVRFFLRHCRGKNFWVLLHNTHFMSDNLRNLSLKRLGLRALLRPFLIRKASGLFCLSEAMKISGARSGVNYSILTNSVIADFCDWCLSSCDVPEASVISGRRYCVVLGGVDEVKRTSESLIRKRDPDIFTVVLGFTQESVLKVNLDNIKNLITFDHKLSEEIFYGYLRNAEYVLDISDGSLYGPFKTSASAVLASSLSMDLR